MKILVTGAEGMLGRAVLARFSDDGAVGVDLPQGDLTDSTVVEQLFLAHAPDWLIHCAAFTDVDGAERERQRARSINTDATGHLAYACQQSGCGITYISTDYVFPGRDAGGYAEDAVRDPVNHYGATKAAGERIVEMLATPWQIVRTSWLFGSGARHFVGTIRRLLAERDVLRVVDDQHGCPTHSEDLAETIHCLVTHGSPGVYHATNRGACTWFEFAREIARQLDDDPRRIQPCSSSEYPTPARRPSCSILLDTRLESAGCPPMPAWEDALSRFLSRSETEPAAG